MSPAVSRQAPGLLVCWLLLDSSISVFLRLDGPSSISRIFLAGAIGLLLFVLIRRPATPMAVDQIELAFGLLLALSLVARVAVPYRPESPAPTVPVAALSLVAFGALAVWGLTWFARWQGAASGDAEPEIGRLIGVIAVALVVGAGLLARFVIVAWDLKPGMDVYPIQDAAGRAVLAGKDPYLTHVFQSGYPYWPLSALLAAGGLVLGDVRWTLLAADAVTLIAFAVIARNVNLPLSVGAIAGALFLWDAGGLYVTWQSMTEPLVIAFIMSGIALLTRPRPRGVLAGVAFGLAIATKQFAVGLLPLLPLSRKREPWIAFAAAVVASAFVLLPFIAADATAFRAGSISSHLAEPPRSYAFNLLDLLPGIIDPVRAPFVITAIAAMIAGSVVRLRWPDAVSGWLAATTALMIVAFGLIGFSFINYYQIPLALILVLALLPEATSGEAE